MDEARSNNKIDDLLSFGTPGRPPRRSRDNLKESARQDERDTPRISKNTKKLENSDPKRSSNNEQNADEEYSSLNGNHHMVQAELHYGGANRGHNGKSDKSVPNGTIRKLSNPSVSGRRSESSRSPPPDTILINIHSLYFVENAVIVSDPRPGEIYVLFDFLGLEYESPLAVVKPNVPNKELTFEFQKSEFRFVIRVV